MSKVLVTEDGLKQITDSIISMVLKKNADYGDAWQSNGAFTALINVEHKIIRLETLSDGRSALVVDENIDDTLRDLVGYSLLCLLKSEHDNNSE